MAGRRKWDNVGEPLFGWDWWLTDQKLFEDAVIRQVPTAACRAPAPAAAGRYDPEAESGSTV